jgi:predicted enzyme related to lactoylglutathione lyase
MTIAAPKPNLPGRRGLRLAGVGARRYTGIMIKHIDFVSVPVVDQKRALAFYTEKLGFSVFTDQPFNDKQRWIELKIGGAQTKVVLFTAEGQEDLVGRFFNATFACDDVHRTYAELREKGVEFLGEPKKQPWGTMVMMKDSEGNQILLSTK